MSSISDAPSKDERDLVLYQVVAARRAGLDSMLWQAPVLGLTAQAFLLTIALDSGVARYAQVTAGLLSAIVAFMSVQLLLKHRVHEVADSVWLHEFEKAGKLPEVHAAAAIRCRSAGVSTGLITRLRSHRVWTVGLAVFGLAGVGSAVAAFIAA